MLTENKVLMHDAWYSLNGRWNDAVVATLVFVAISAVCGGVAGIGWIAGFVIGGPLMLGYVAFIVAYLDRGPGGKVETVFSGFNNFLNAFIAQLLMGIFVLLWALLLVIPGILAAYSYSMTFFIMNDNPGLSGQDAITRSKQMMAGNRWKLFCLDLRYLGWWILCGLTLGILALWITPYYYTARTMFYRDLLAQERMREPAARLDGFYVPSDEPPTTSDEPPFAP